MMPVAHTSLVMPTFERHESLPTMAAYRSNSVGTTAPNARGRTTQCTAVKKLKFRSRVVLNRLCGTEPRLLCITLVTMVSANSAKVTAETITLKFRIAKQTNRTYSRPGA